MFKISYKGKTIIIIMIVIGIDALMVPLKAKHFCSSVYVQY